MRGDRRKVQKYTSSHTLGLCRGVNVLCGLCMVGLIDDDDGRTVVVERYKRKEQTTKIKEERKEIITNIDWKT